LTLKDLLFCEDNPIKPSIGVYIFFDQDDNVIYVGKSSSRSFIERIPPHFDFREKTWFRTLSKLWGREKNGGYNEKVAIKSSKEALDQCSIILISVNNVGRKNAEIVCSKLEKILKLVLKPAFQRNQPFVEYSKHTKLRNFLKSKI